MPSHCCRELVASRKIDPLSQILQVQVQLWPGCVQMELDLKAYLHKAQFLCRTTASNTVRIDPNFGRMLSYNMVQHNCV
jgi:hypothetical protein